MDIIPSPKKNVIMDATLMTSVINCARFTELRFEKQLVQISGKSNSLEVGSIVHKVLETYYKAIINGVKRPDAIQFGLASGELYVRGCQHCMDFISEPCPVCHTTTRTGPMFEPIKCINCIDGMTRTKCGHPPNEYPGVKNTPVENQSKPDRVGWKHALDTCEQYFDHYKNDFWVPLFVETVKREVIYEDDEIRVMWKAKLDLGVDTNNGIYPVDHKSMKQRRDSGSLNNQFKGQCILMRTRGVIINKIGFQTSLKPEEKFTRPMVSYTADNLLEFQSEIVPHTAYKLLEYTDSGYWPATGHGVNCEGKFGPCVFHEVCKADRGLRESILKNNFVVGPKWDIDNVED